MGSLGEWMGPYLQGITHMHATQASQETFKGPRRSGSYRGRETLNNEQKAELLEGMKEVTSGIQKLVKERDALQAELSAERARRIKAEEVVDAIIANEGCCIQHADESAQSYRAQYPRVEKEQRE